MPLSVLTLTSHPHHADAQRIEAARQDRAAEAEVKKKRNEEMTATRKAAEVRVCGWLCVCVYIDVYVY